MISSVGIRTLDDQVPPSVKVVLTLTTGDVNKWQSSGSGAIAYTLRGRNSRWHGAKIVEGS